MTIKNFSINNNYYCCYAPAFWPTGSGPVSARTPYRADVSRSITVAVLCTVTRGSSVLFWPPEQKWYAHLRTTPVLQWKKEISAQSLNVNQLNWLLTRATQWQMSAFPRWQDGQTTAWCALGKNTKRPLDNSGTNLNTWAKRNHNELKWKKIVTALLMSNSLDYLPPLRLTVWNVFSRRPSWISYFWVLFWLKNVFHLCGLNQAGKPVFSKRVSRKESLQTVANIPAFLIGVEASTGAFYWPREFEKLGHNVKVISPQYVKPFVRGQKNDGNDAQTIAVALMQPTMQFVPPKSPEQQDILALYLAGLAYY